MAMDFDGPYSVQDILEELQEVHSLQTNIHHDTLNTWFCLIYRQDQ